MSFLYDEPKRTGNIIVDHWKGSYSLPRAYWINNFLIANAITFAVIYGSNALEESSLSLQVISLFQIASIILALAIWTWSIVGIWRSADAHEDRGGSASWAGLAKLAVIFGLLGSAGQYSQQMPGFVETAKLAFGSDSLGESAELAVRGDTLTLTGALASGASLEVSKVLQDNPQIRRVVLSSIGGRIIEGSRIGELISERSLETHVDGTCESACTLALLAGERRTASLGSTVGFHQPSFPGTTTYEQQAMINELQDEYKAAGLPYVFIRRAMQASADTMWYPNEEELFEAGVLNSVDRERVIADQLASAGKLNRQAPAAVDEFTTLVGAKAVGNVLRQEFEVSLSYNQLDPSFFQGELVELLRQDVCSLTLVPRLIEAGATYEFSYRDSAGLEFATIKVDHC